MFFHGSAMRLSSALLTIAGAGVHWYFVSAAICWAGSAAAMKIGFS
jgi:hypothetical protein